jgi:hypothetical protein
LYNKNKLIFSRGGKMRIHKEDLHLLVDLVNDKDTKLVYDLISVVIEKNNEKEIVVEADNSPLTEKEKKILKQAEIDIENDDLIDWDDLHA